jgi:CheY-like chemotaxis protein
LTPDFVMVGAYDARVVALSLVIAVLASYVALDLGERVTAARWWARLLWLTGGATAMGLGIWAMHYSAMLAFHLPVPMWWDGEARVQLDPRVGVGQTFRVPLRASPLEIVGADAEGALLLAICPLPNPEAVEADGARHLSMTFEGGQIMTIDIARGEGTSGEEGVYVIQLTYIAPAAVRAFLPRPRPKMAPRGATVATAPVPRIGLVEDDPFIRHALMSLLRSAGLHVEAFASAEAFLDHASRACVDCLILDVHLPGMSGLALQRTLTERQVPTPIIFLTGHDDPTLARQAQDAGAIAWLTKPVQGEDLLHAITEASNLART